MLTKGDVVIALSASGENRRDSSPAGNVEADWRRADQLLLRHAFHLSACERRGPGLFRRAGGLHPGLAPTASTTTMLALGDALAIAIPLARVFAPKILPIFIPAKARQAADARRTANAFWRRRASCFAKDGDDRRDLRNVEQGLGMTTVVAEGKLVGLLSDGDLRRLLERDGASALAKTAERRCIQIR